MKLLIVATAMASLLVAGPVQARKDCTELKSEIAARIDANGVKDYTLEIVPADSNSEAKIVGSCDGGTQRIVYQRGGARDQTLVAGKTQ
jgi:hypothetical protein